MHLQHIKEDGTEYWFARELAAVLDYNKWENFFQSHEHFVSIDLLSGEIKKL